ncbi:4Fe-4S ferredoxin N-terminal domain-containing protein [Natrialbaceae archaeon GCM10025810]|uniref:4Fe-4S ferredoxin N-terminal domain-containing protein n=1 Tax=Halovalidus salilacus TaxID=3075124 RepID=UPI0036084F0B
MSADDELFPDEGSFHPLGEEWESELEGMLDETEYDTQLGIDMARDAMRVTAGELSEAEFHAKYHEDVLDEFGVDDRPTAAALEELEEDEGGLVDALKNFDGDGEMDRREVMKKMGVAGAALGLGGWAATDDSQPDVGAAAESEEDEGTQWGMAIDLERCDGCLSCVQGCAEENGLDPGVNWMYVMAWEDENTETPEDPSVGEYNLLVRPCQHCTDAPCEKVCPTTARHTRNKDGLVLTDYDVCIGCRYCMVACPYGVNYFAWDDPDIPEEDIPDDHIYVEESEESGERRLDSRAPRGVMSKCTMCPSRQDGQMGDDMVATTACEEACADMGMNVIHFGDLNDPESKPNRYLDARREQAREDGNDVDGLDGEDYAESSTAEGNLSTFRLLEHIGTGPNVIYIGDEPGAEAEQVDGPTAYEDLTAEYEGENKTYEWDLVDNRKEVLDEGTVGGA